MRPRGPDKTAQTTRYCAIHLLVIAASGRGGETLEQISDALGFRSPEPLRLARRMLAETVGAGTWREARAEAAARLRTVVNRAERVRCKVRRERSGTQRRRRAS